MLVSVEESSRLLSVHHATLRRWIAAGKVPVVRLGRRVLIRREALEKLIRRAERPAREGEATR